MEMPPESAGVITFRPEWWLEILLDHMKKSRIQWHGLPWLYVKYLAMLEGMRIVPSEHTKRFWARRGWIE